MIDTPRTETVSRHIDGFSDKWVPQYVSEDLERELNEARERLTAIEIVMRCALGGHPDSELWGEAGLIAATMRCVDTLSEVTEQRDRLAEALERILSYQGRFAEEDPESIAAEALQSLTPNEL